MTRLKGKLLNIEERKGTTKEGKPYTIFNCLVLDQDNDVSVVRVFDRDGSVERDAKKLKNGSDAEFKIDKIERLPNRTFDALGQIVIS